MPSDSPDLDPELRDCVEEKVHFVWLDHEGAECSPRHAKFHTALRFHEMYATRSQRRQKAQEKIDATYGDQAHEVSSWQYPEGHTKTGSPPVKLERRVLRTYPSDLTPAQQTVLDSYLASYDD